MHGIGLLRASAKCAGLKRLMDNSNTFWAHAKPRRTRRKSKAKVKAHDVGLGLVWCAQADDELIASFKAGKLKRG